MTHADSDLMLESNVLVPRIILLVGRTFLEKNSKILQNITLEIYKN